MEKAGPGEAPQGLQRKEGNGGGKTCGTPTYTLQRDHPCEPWSHSLYLIYSPFYLCSAPYQAFLDLHSIPAETYQTAGYSHPMTPLE